jgi:sRNA-binding carbon storage regulator CsrA
MRYCELGEEQSITIGEEITVTILEVLDEEVCLRIETPNESHVVRCQVADTAVLRRQHAEARI